MDLIQVMRKKNNMWIVVNKHENLGLTLTVQNIEIVKHYAIQVNKEV